MFWGGRNSESIKQIKKGTKKLLKVEFIHDPVMFLKQVLDDEGINLYFVFQSHFTFHDCSFGKMCYSVRLLTLKPATQRPLRTLAIYKLIEDREDEGTKS